MVRYFKKHHWFSLFARRFSALFLGGVMAATATIPVQAATIHETGISTGGTLLAMNDAQLDARLRDIRLLGAVWLRIDFNWSHIQPDNYHAYDWGRYDRIVRAAHNRGFKILAVLAYTPPWARSALCAKLKPAEEAGSKCAPRSATEFARFSRASVIRYEARGLHVWEIWNEPNLVGHWKTVRGNKKVVVDPKAYAQVANAAARELKRFDPGALVITGGLAPVAQLNYPRGMRQGDYLKQLLPFLNKNLFDAIGMHPYTWPNRPGVAVNYNAFYTVDNGRPDVNLRTIMGRAGWGKKQLWATEFGASTRGKTTPSQALAAGTRPDHVAESMQAQIIRLAVERWHKKANVGPIFVHADADRWLMQRSNDGGFGLRRFDGTKKPSYDAFDSATRSLKR